MWGILVSLCQYILDKIEVILIFLQLSHSISLFKMYNLKVHVDNDNLYVLK